MDNSDKNKVSFNPFANMAVNQQASVSVSPSNSQPFKPLPQNTSSFPGGSNTPSLPPPPNAPPFPTQLSKTIDQLSQSSAQTKKTQPLSKDIFLANQAFTSLMEQKPSQTNPFAKSTSNQSPPLQPSGQAKATAKKTGKSPTVQKTKIQQPAVPPSTNFISFPQSNPQNNKMTQPIILGPNQKPPLPQTQPIIIDCDQVQPQNTIANSITNTSSNPFNQFKNNFVPSNNNIFSKNNISNTDALRQNPQNAIPCLAKNNEEMIKTQTQPNIQPNTQPKQSTQALKNQNSSGMPLTGIANVFNNSNPSNNPFPLGKNTNNTSPVQQPNIAKMFANNSSNNNTNVGVTGTNALPNNSNNNNNHTFVPNSTAAQPNFNTNANNIPILQQQAPFNPLQPGNSQAQNNPNFNQNHTKINQNDHFIPYMTAEQYNLKRQMLEPLKSQQQEALRNRLETQFDLEQLTIGKFINNSRRILIDIYKQIDYLSKRPTTLLEQHSENHKMIKFCRNIDLTLRLAPGLTMAHAADIQKHQQQIADNLQAMEAKLIPNEDQHQLSEELTDLQEMEEEVCEEKMQVKENSEYDLLEIYCQLTTIEEELEQLGKRADRYLQSLNES